MYLVPPTGTEPIKENTSTPLVGTPATSTYNKTRSNTASLADTKADTTQSNYFVFILFLFDLKAKIFYLL